MWQAGPRRWVFPTAGAPATLTFGYLRDRQDKYRYGSSEFQFIAFDELTEFPEDDYLFLFSRLRRTRDLVVPLRMRSASNPGNVGHAWVKGRFVAEAVTLASPERQRRESEPAAQAALPGESASLHAQTPVANAPGSQTPVADARGSRVEILWKESRAFVPARIADNPAMNEAEYRQSLSHLPAVYRERLMHGDWEIQAAGLIRLEWLRYYTLRGRIIELRDAAGGLLAAIDERECQRFVTCDPAGTSADRAAEHRGRPASWSVAQVWDVCDLGEGHAMVLRHQWRDRVGFDGLCKALRDVHRDWKPRRLLIEGEKLGQAAVDVLSRELPIECVDPGYSDKVARAAEFFAKLERGEVYLPKHDNDWRPALEAEWLAWTGLGIETTDQIDAAAYAARELARGPTGPVKIGRVHWPARGARF